MTGRIAVTVSSFEEFDRAFDSMGLRVGPRSGPTKRTNDDMEWYVVRNFLREAIPEGLFEPPFSVRKRCPPAPDFDIVRGGDPEEVIALVEITEATDKEDQREMTKIGRSGQPTMLGAAGGRFLGGAANPKWPWSQDVLDAIGRKQNKAIFLVPQAVRHLIIYPNSNASTLLFTEQDEREAIITLFSAINDDAKRLTQIANGCFVHILGKEYVFLDILGTRRLVRRRARRSD